MPGTPLRKANAGDDLLEVLTADSMNAWSEAAEFIRAHQLDQPGNPLEYQWDPYRVLIRNDTGVAKERYDILSPTGIVFTPTDNLRGFQTKPLLTGTLPTLANSGNFVILLQPAGTHASNKCAKAAIAGGLWPVKIQVNHIQQLYADVAADSARLTSNWYGRAKIIYKESGTGEKWALVELLPDMFRGPLKAVVTQTGGIDLNSSGEVTIWKNGAAMTGTGSTVTAHYNWLYNVALAEDQRVMISWFADEQKWVIEIPWC